MRDGRVARVPGVVCSFFGCASGSRGRVGNASTTAARARGVSARRAARQLGRGVDFVQAFSREKLETCNWDVAAGVLKGAHRVAQRRVFCRIPVSVTMKPLSRPSKRSHAIAARRAKRYMAMNGTWTWFAPRARRPARRRRAAAPGRRIPGRCACRSGSNNSRGARGARRRRRRPRRPTSACPPGATSA